MLVDHLLKTKKEFKNLKKQELQAIFTKINLIRRAFSTTSLPGKSLSGSGVNISLDFNEELAKELYKSIIRNLKKRTVYSRFKDMDR